MRKSICFYGFFCIEMNNYSFLKLMFIIINIFIVFSMVLEQKDKNSHIVEQFEQYGHVLSFESLPSLYKRSVSTSLTALWKTYDNPSLVKALHYLNKIFLFYAYLRPYSLFITFGLWYLSSRRSILLPTIIRMAWGFTLFTSGIHLVWWSVLFSRDEWKMCDLRRSRWGGRYRHLCRQEAVIFRITIVQLYPCLQLNVPKS